MKQLRYGDCECINILTGRTDSVISLIKIDENTISSASGDKTIKIWKNFL